MFMFERLMYLCLGLIDTYAFAWEGPMPGFGRRCGLRRFLDF